MGLDFEVKEMPFRKEPTIGGGLVESVVVYTVVEVVEKIIVNMGFGGEEERRWW